MCRLNFAKKTFVGFGFVMIILSSWNGNAIAEETIHFPQQVWSFTKVLGGFDRESAQRGLQVYQSVCASCHSLKRVAYRNLEALGYDNNDIKGFASQFEVKFTDDEGETAYRNAIPSDYFVSPFPNEQAARTANNGALPPDLSLIMKARTDSYNRIYSLLTGYTDAPPGVEVADGMYYNPWFEGQRIAMAPPLSDGQVEYSDGTAASVDQMTRDVVTFLAWAAEPELEERKSMGIKVILFLIVFALIAYINKKRVWAKVNADKKL